MRQLALLLILFARAFGQTSQVPYDETGPTFLIRDGADPYPGSYLSIRKVDFRNLPFHGDDDNGKPINLRNGHYKHDDPYGHFSIDLGSIHYLTSASSKGGSALVMYSWFGVGGSSSQGGNALVFTVSDGHLRSVQGIDWDTHFQAGQPTESFDAKTGTLVIRSAHYIPGDAHCCVSAMDVVTFKWDGNHFVQSGIQTALSEYGKREGKTLPH